MDRREKKSNIEIEDYRTDERSGQQESRTGRNRCHYTPPCLSRTNPNPDPDPDYDPNPTLGSGPI
jgi:hypothetical protein